MKERPILFSGPMIRAILDGRKTQTRRIIKHERASRGLESGWLLKPYGFLNDRQFAKAACPYGQPGDRLWVRETFCADWTEDRGIQYRADGGLDADMFDAGCTWRPSIHMPRRASRITMEITGVRVECLQDISEADALAEGCNACPSVDWPISSSPYRSAYALLWEQINGLGSWAANPWVWVIEFRRLDGVDGAEGR